MYYTTPNFRSLTALIRALQRGDDVLVWRPYHVIKEDGDAKKQKGYVTVVGPWHPAEQKYEVRAKLEDGVIVALKT